MYPRDDFFAAGAALRSVFHLSGTREALVDYALTEDILWALPGFLAGNGLLDDDWRRRLREAPAGE
jgi:hypothetical protein